MAVEYATVDDVEAVWRPLSDAEKAQAETLIAHASQRLRRRLAARGVDLDATIAAGQLDLLDATIVVTGMVKRAMIGGAAGEGVTQQSQGVGPFSLSQTYANPQGNLYVTDAELNDLTPIDLLSGRRFRSVRMDGL